MPDCRVAFSALNASVAGPIEQRFAEAGYTVVSNARSHRFAPDVPIVVPEVNGHQLAWITRQPYSGAIVTNPNCVVAGLALGLKPLHDAFGLTGAHITTLQAASGAGYPGVPSLDLLDNVLPCISGEAEKIDRELQKVLEVEIPVSVQTHRVPVTDGHLVNLSISLEKNPSLEEIRSVWESFPGLALPLAPKQPVHVLQDPMHPQPKLHRNLERGMAVSVGQLQRCPILGYRFTLLVHNTIRGAAGGTLLIGALLSAAEESRTTCV